MVVVVVVLNDDGAVDGAGAAAGAALAGAGVGALCLAAEASLIFSEMGVRGICDCEHVRLSQKSSPLRSLSIALFGMVVIVNRLDQFGHQGVRKDDPVLQDEVQHCDPSIVGAASATMSSGLRKTAFA